MLTVADIMTPNVVTLRSSVTVAQAMLLMQQENVRSIVIDPEVQGGVYGLLTLRDVVYQVTAKAADPAQVIVCEIMQKPCLIVDPQSTLTELAQRFAEAGRQQAVVLSQGRLVGLVSVTDVVMKSVLDPVVLPQDFPQRLQTALQHKRLSWSSQWQIEQECAIAWNTVKELQPAPLDANVLRSHPQTPNLPKRMTHASAPTRPICHPWFNS